MRVTGDRSTGQLLGVQLFGHRHAEIASWMDIAATAIFQHVHGGGAVPRADSSRRRAAARAGASAMRAGSDKMVMYSVPA